MKRAEIVRRAKALGGIHRHWPVDDIVWHGNDIGYAVIFKNPNYRPFAYHYEKSDWYYERKTGRKIDRDTLSKTVWVREDFCND